MRIGVLIAAALWLAPVITVGMTGLGMPPLGAFLLACVLAIALAWTASKPLATTLATALAGNARLIAVAIVMAAVAVVFIARESVYMADSTQPAYSLMPDDPWRVEHSCMSGYF